MKAAYARRIGLSMVALAGCFGLCPAAPAVARPITFAFTGEAKDIVDLAYQIYPEYVREGSEFSGWLTFETTTPNATPDSATEATYVGAILDCHVQLGALSLDFITDTTNNDIATGNDMPISPPWDYRDFYGFHLPIAILDTPVTGGIGLIDDTATALDSLAIQEMPPSLEDFDRKWFVFNVIGQGIRIEGQLHSLTLVPEPGAMSILGLGAVFFSTRRARRNR